MLIQNWRREEIEVYRSRGGVLAVADPWDNLVRGEVSPWPPPELIQKVYQSRHSSAFNETELQGVSGRLGFYSDLQSISSEDSLTWSVFGTVAYAQTTVRKRFVVALLELLEVDAGVVESAGIWLWRRLPHPDTLVPGGPEIDFGIITDEVFLLGEAKWHSPVGTAQGKNRDKDQLTLRHEFCAKYGRRLLPDCRSFVVLALSKDGGVVAPAESTVDSVQLLLRDTTWKAVCELPEHPHSEGLLRHLEWKTTHSAKRPSPRRL